MNSKNPDTIKISLNIINELCNQLDFLASPNLEEKMIDSLDCYQRALFTNAEQCKAIRSIIGDERLKLVHQLEEMLEDVCWHENAKGFSKTQRWLNFVDFVNAVNILLKKDIQKHKVMTENSK
jgi:hypothetical protein